jgi:hypothetical protein
VLAKHVEVESAEEYLKRGWKRDMGWEKERGTNDLEPVEDSFYEACGVCFA